MLLFIKNMLQLILSPGRGWEDISHEGRDPERLVSEGLYPIIGLASVSVFIQKIYHSDFDIVTLLERAMIIFISYYVTLFIARIIFQSCMRKYVDGEPNNNKFTTMTVYSIALMAFITIIDNLLPVHMDMLYLLPIAIALIMWKASAYLAVKKDRDYVYAIWAIVAIIVPPMLLQYIFVSIIS